MEIPDLPVLGFYDNPSECTNFIFIERSDNGLHLVRFGEYNIVRNHPGCYDRFREEVAVASGLDSEEAHDDFGHLTMSPWFRIKGGGHVGIMCEGHRHWKFFEESNVRLHGESSTYGPADLEQVAEVIRAEQMFDNVEIKVY